MKEIVQFLEGIETNNNKDWFEQHKDQYQHVRRQFMYITEVLINEIRSFDKNIGALEASKCIFRIYRDLRFTKDKRPFKNYFGAYIAAGGRSGDNPGYYLHIQPGASFVSGGIYKPDSIKLKAIRNEIYNYPTDFIDIITDEQFSKTFTLYKDDKLKTLPRGYSAEFEYPDLLRYKSFAPAVNISDRLISDPNIIDSVVNYFRMILPFNQFIYHALDQ